MEERIEEEGQVEGGGIDTDRDDEVSDEEGEDLMEVRFFGFFGWLVGWCMCVSLDWLSLVGKCVDVDGQTPCLRPSLTLPPQHPLNTLKKQNMEADYVAIPELDTYDLANLDTREYGAMDFDARRAAEEEIARRCVLRSGVCCLGFDGGFVVALW